jgi:uncharacterized protein YecE (DUF72 family)
MSAVSMKNFMCASACDGPDVVLACARTLRSRHVTVNHRRSQRVTHVGCAALPPRVSRSAYFSALEYLEAALWYDATVKSATWKRWSEESPEGSLGLIAPKVVCAMKPSPAFDAAFAPFTAALDDRVSAVIFPTPPTFSPSSANRDLLRRFFGELATPDQLGERTRVWRPSGLWDLATAVKAASEAGVVVSWDPFSDLTVPPETYEAIVADAMYWRPVGLGRKGPLSPDHLERLATLGEAHATSWIVLATPEPWKDAKRLRDLVQK